MPQASADLREMIRRRFGDPVSDAGPTKYLEDAGYVLQENWLWTPKPGVKDLKDMSNTEWLCLFFLIEEWDFGGLANG